MIIYLHLSTQNPLSTNGLIPVIEGSCRFIEDVHTESKYDVISSKRSEKVLPSAFNYWLTALVHKDLTKSEQEFSARRIHDGFKLL